MSATFGPAPLREDEQVSEGRRRQLEELKKRNHRLMVDGKTVLDGVSYDEAREAVPDDVKERWSIAAVYHAGRSYERTFNVAFGYRTGTTSTADLARMGVPIHPPLTNESKR